MGYAGIVNLDGMANCAKRIVLTAVEMASASSPMGYARKTCVNRDITGYIAQTDARYFALMMDQVS